MLYYNVRYFGILSLNYFARREKMQLTSLQFLIFLPIVALMNYIIPKKFRYIWLLIASVCFYASLDLKGIPVLLFTILSTYLAGLLIDKKEGNIKKVILFAAIAANILILALSKYSGLTIFAVVGISFFMFMAISYCIDVYRGKISSEKNILQYALFVSFFPNVTSGPIERAGNMLPQFKEPKDFDYDRVVDGLLQMLWGYFMKLVIADRAGVLVNAIFSDPKAYAGTATFVAASLYGFEIYCDFGGYSNIAIGCARVLGYDLMKNFNSPFLAGSIAGYWRNWHISLSSWFKDYLYIPLGGNRKGTLRKYLNIIIVFIVSGLWHGAGITFAIWGLLHGLYQVIGYILMPVRDKLCSIFKVNREGFSHKLLKIAITFSLLNVGWIFFRVTNFKDAVYMAVHLFELHPGVLFDGTFYQLGLNRPNVILLVIAIMILIAADIAGLMKINIREKIMSQGLWLRWLIYITAIVVIVTCGIWGPGYNETGFIYVQF
ncbi:MAG: MBOAT family protein [Butyrivibrio sp.]|nr:MBOAT family protein [Butyrivibrio sp.]